MLGDALESDGYALHDWGDVAKDTSTVEDYSIEITLVAGDKFKGPLTVWRGRKACRPHTLQRGEAS